jgi:hypothetical protein
LQTHLSGVITDSAASNFTKRALTFCRSPQEGGAAQVDEGAVDEKIVFGRNLRTLEGGAPRLAQAVNLPADLLG